MQITYFKMKITPFYLLEKVKQSLPRNKVAPSWSWERPCYGVSLHSFIPSIIYLAKKSTGVLFLQQEYNYGVSLRTNFLWAKLAFHTTLWRTQGEERECVRVSYQYSQQCVHPSASVAPEHLQTPPQAAICTGHSYATEVPSGRLDPPLLAAVWVAKAAEPSRTPPPAPSPASSRKLI